MPDSESAEAKEEIKSQGKNLTLAQRINQLGITSKFTEPVGPQEFCIICGNPRIDPEPTGLVCNNSQCLLELRENYNESEEKAKDWFYKLLKEIAKRIGGIDISEDVKTACEKINKKLDEITGDLAESVLGSLICADLSNSTDDLSEISEKLQRAVEEIIEALRRKEEKTD